MMGRLLDLHPQYRVIADEIREEGRKEGRKEGREEGRKEGRAAAKAEIALKMYRSGIDVKVIEKCTGLDRRDLLHLVEKDRRSAALMEHSNSAAPFRSD